MYMILDFSSKPDKSWWCLLFLWIQGSLLRLMLGLEFIEVHHYVAMRISKSTNCWHLYLAYPFLTPRFLSWSKELLLITLHFFFKFVSWEYCSKIHRPNESPRKQKMLPWKSFWNKTTLKPRYFWAGGALDARMRGCLNITSAQKWYAVIFQISAEKSFQA